MKIMNEDLKGIKVLKSKIVTGGPEVVVAKSL